MANHLITLPRLIIFVNLYPSSKSHFFFTLKNEPNPKVSQQELSRFLRKPLSFFLISRLLAFLIRPYTLLMNKMINFHFVPKHKTPNKQKKLDTR